MWPMSNSTGKNTIPHTPNWIVTALLGIVLLVVALLSNACSISYDRNQVGFWDQCIKVDAWGLSYVSPYGPVNLGKLTYERNVNCPKDIKEQTPGGIIIP